MQRIARVVDLVERALTFTVAVLMGALAVVVCWQVFSRYVLRASPYWTEELAVLGLMWIGLLGAAAGVWRGSHMSLELVVRRLPRVAQICAEVAIDVAIGIFAWFLCTQGWVLAEATMTSTMSTLPMRVGVSYLVLPIAGGLMIAFAALRALRRIVAAGTGGSRHE